MTEATTGLAPAPPPVTSRQEIRAMDARLQRVERENRELEALTRLYRHQRETADRHDADADTRAVPRPVAGDAP